jgi:hypothetical protein
MARPQCAMPQLGSAWATAAKLAVAAGHAKEWYSAMARLNSACAAALHSSLNATLPRRSAATVWPCPECAAAGLSWLSAEDADTGPSSPIATAIGVR